MITKATAKNSSTPAAPSAISPVDLAKPMMCTLTPSFSCLARIASRDWLTACRSRRKPVSGSTSCKFATTMAALKSLETIRPTQSDFSTFSRTAFSCSGVPEKSAATMLPPLKPSSTTSL
ncbi:hypothetical protein D9M73_250140 [compost metagenome]